MCGENTAHSQNFAHVQNCRFFFFFNDLKIIKKWRFFKKFFFNDLKIIKNCHFFQKIFFNYKKS